MALTKAQIRTIVRINIGNRTDQDTTIDNGIAAGVLDLCSQFEFRGMQSATTIAVVTNDLSKALPAGTYKVLNIVVRDGLNSWTIELRSKKWLLEQYPLPSALPAGRPAYCYEENGTLYFSSKFNAGFTIDVTLMNYEAFVNDADTLLYLPQVDNALVSYATSYTFRSLQQFEEAATWDMQYQRELRIALRADRRNNGQVVSALPREPTTNWQNPYDPFVKESNSDSN